MKHVERVNRTKNNRNNLLERPMSIAHITALSSFSASPTRKEEYIEGVSRQRVVVVLSLLRKELGISTLTPMKEKLQ